MTHVLLTRSPLSPGPKPWFSLDLHVLSAPPAFVLSQDQTLREDWFAGRAGNLRFELVLKVSPPSAVQPAEEVTRFLRPPSRKEAERSRRFTLLSFQGPALAWNGIKKPLIRAEASAGVGMTYPASPESLQIVSNYRDFSTPPVRTARG